MARRQIAGAEVTLNFPAAKRVRDQWLVDLMMDSTHYMNVHEIGFTGGVPVSFGRDAFEQSIGYVPVRTGTTHEAQDREDRPRYGALNVFRSGIGAAPGYGDCALVLHPQILQASTITLRDSLDKKGPLIGTSEALDHCLVQLHKTMDATFWQRWLSDLLRAARGMADPSTNVNAYAEVQIHAVVEFPADVIYLRGSFESQFGVETGERLQHWARRQGWPLVWGVQDEMVLDPTVQFPTSDGPDKQRPNWSDAVGATARRFAEFWAAHAHENRGKANANNSRAAWSELWKATAPAARYTPSATENVPITMKDLAGRLSPPVHAMR